MLAIERQRRILAIVEQRAEVTIGELREQFGVSAETIRKDLMYLEREGKLLRTHGGAVSLRDRKTDLPLEVRKQTRNPQKRQLCSFVMRYIREGDVLAVDAGSTTLELAEMLAASYQRLTVVTHSLEICRILAENAGIHVILCGGTYNPGEESCGGYLTVEAASRVHTNKAIICPTGLSRSFGITDISEETVAVQRTYMENAEQVLILADSCKFEHCTRLKICEASREFLYITDSEFSLQEEYRDYQVIYQ